ncbi:MAG: arginase family protein, partial [Candidatus Aenigmarchaeota archaeon]|nr:arginase family protein [Candidatus Aenigmarchaeota archaeon]
VLPIIELIAKTSNIIGMDVVEVRPLEDRKTEVLAARLIFKSLLYKISNFNEH